MWLRTCRECGGSGELVPFTFANPMVPVEPATSRMCHNCGGSGYEEYTDKEVKELGVEDGQQEWYYTPF